MMGSTGMDSTGRNIFGRKQMDQKELAEVKALETLCNQADGLSMKLNWDMLTERTGEEVNDFLCCDENGQLIGFLALYGFGQAVIEVSGMVHPDYRREGVFTGLLRRAKNSCAERTIRDLLFICERKSEAGLAFVKSISAIYDHSEHRMDLPGDMEPIDSAGQVQLRRAVPGDVDLLTELDVICFGMTEDEARDFNSFEHMQLSSELYVVDLNDMAIGKIRLQIQDNTIMIYAFGILPQYRRKGYGRTVLALAVNAALARRPKNVGLEVDCVNDAALALYQSCGFKRTATYDYYRMPI